MPNPVKRRRALIGPGERVELILDFRHLAGERVGCEAAAGPRTAGSRRTTFDGPLMEFRVGRKATDTTRRPGEPAAAARLGQGRLPRPPTASGSSRSATGFTPTWLINGKTFDPSQSQTPSRCSGRPRPGSFTTAPRSRT